MTTPALLLGGLIASLIGFSFHLVRGGNLMRLMLYLILSWLGFWLGQFLAMRLGWTFASIGSLHLGLAVSLSLAVLFFGYWLSLVEVVKK